ncbi:hypothetical protein [Sphaerotilus mobilis]|nr:hypothetical protein [Sphaerotilus mobilis]
MPVQAGEGPSDAPADAWVLGIRLDHHDDAAPLRAHGDDDEVRRRLDPRPGRNRAWIDDEVRAERRWGAWTLGALARSRVDIRVDASTLDLIGHVERDTAASPQHRAWNVDARAVGFAGRGLALGWQAGSLDAEADAGSGWLEVQGLQLTRWIEQRWSGEVVQDPADGRYAVHLQSWRRDDRQVAPFLAPPDPHGQALLLAGGLRWRFAPDWQLTASVHDLGWLRWRGIVEEQTVVSTDTEQRDADGRVMLAPLMQGQVRARRAWAAAPAGSQLRLEWRASARHHLSWTTRGGASGFGGPQFGWLTRLSPAHAVEWTALGPRWPVRRWGLTWQVFTQAMGSASGPGSTACSGWTIGLATDRLSADRRSLSGQLGWRACS